MIKRVLRYLCYGIAWGSFAFVLVNGAGVLAAGSEWRLPTADNFLAQALGCWAVGICSASSAIVYTFKNLARWQQTGIHFAVGLTGYFAVAYGLNWMPMYSVEASLLFVLCSVILFAAIWLGFFLFNRYEVKKMNRRLRELRDEQEKEKLEIRR